MPIPIKRNHVFVLMALLLTAWSANGNNSGKMVTEPESLNKFFEEVFEQSLARSPMQQSYLGIKDDYDKWDDISDKKLDEDLKLAKENLAYMKANFDFEKLDDQAKLSYLLFENKMNYQIEGDQWRYHNYPVNQMGGAHSRIPSFLINIHRISSVDDAKAYIGRLNGVEHYIDQVIVNLKIREQKGILPPKFVFPYALQDINNILTGIPFDKSSTESPLYEDFKNKVDALEIKAKQKKKLLAKARKALRNSVLPAYRKLLKVLEKQEKLATTEDGAWKLPQGDEYYAYRLRRMTTTNLSADEIHEYGLSEVKRIHNEMREIMKKVEFKGSLQDFFNFMKTDKQFYYPDSDAGRKTYLDISVEIVEKMKQRIGEVFITKPKADMVVKAVEPFREKSAGWAFYQRPAIDGSRPGTFYVNLYRMTDNPSYSAEALAYHEGIPGHHMQISIAQELKDIPKFRKFSGYTAYSEGWGLYSERLPKEMGLYQDPYSDFGRLSMELWRAIRLVVDTGLHNKKWTRQQTIDYHVQNAPQPLEQAIRATERYIVTPGQATAYKIGMRKILELREVAKAQLGEAFNLGEYHDVVLTNGPVPLSVLEDNVAQWIKTKLPKS